MQHYIAKQAPHQIRSSSPEKGKIADFLDLGMLGSYRQGTALNTKIQWKNAQWTWDTQNKRSNMGWEEKEFPGSWWREIPKYGHTSYTENCEAGQKAPGEIQQDETAYLMKLKMGAMAKSSWFSGKFIENYV